MMDTHTCLGYPLCYGCVNADAIEIFDMPFGYHLTLSDKCLNCSELKPASFSIFCSDCAFALIASPRPRRGLRALQTRFHCVGAFCTSLAKAPSQYCSNCLYAAIEHVQKKRQEALAGCI